MSVKIVDKSNIVQNQEYGESHFLLIFSSELSDASTRTVALNLSMFFWKYSGRTNHILQSKESNKFRIDLIGFFMRESFHIPGITHNNSHKGVKKIEYLDPVAH